MSAGPESQVNVQAIEQERRRLSRRLDEVARLCETEMPAGQFYGEMLKRLLESLAAPAGAAWLKTAQGNLQLQFQINADQVGLNRSDETKKTHDALLRLAFTKPQPMHLMPRSGVGPAAEGEAAAGNPTDFLLLVVPIVLNEQVAGLIEVWQSPNRPLQAVNGFLQYMALMADLCTRYQRKQMIDQMSGQQALWAQLEAFSRLIHGTLKPMEVAYQVANEARRLIGCDRVSVAVRYGGKAKIEAVSGADVVEKRSNLIVLMRNLSDAVIKWGEKLVFKGVKDDTLPPKVLEALDLYLAESGSKLLVIQPLKDEREKDSTRPPRAALVMEAFEPPEDPQQQIARLDVVAKHATSALYNAVEHHRIPMRFLWMPIARVQEGLGGKAKAIGMGVAVGVTALASILCFVPYPMKMEANGELVPEVTRWVSPPAEGQIKLFHVRPKQRVAEGQILARLENSDRAASIGQMQKEYAALNDRLDTLNQILADNAAGEKTQTIRDIADLKSQLKFKSELLKAAKDRFNYDEDTDGKGFFNLKAPKFTPEELQKLRARGAAADWTILNPNFKDDFNNRGVSPRDQVLRLGAHEGPWEVRLKIPQKNLGQVLKAFAALKTPDNPNPELDVDFLLTSKSTHTFRGKMRMDRVAGQADPSQTAMEEAEPVVVATVRIEGEGIPVDYQVDRDLLTAGTEVHAKVRCGHAPMGYALFYGLWEFFYEKVVFFF